MSLNLFLFGCYWISVE